MGKQSESAPFAVLGDKLKTLRQQQKESLAEAAGAVEIAEEELLRIEEGVDRPSEEILMLLITHFGIKEDDAVSLWELAGYDNEEEPQPETHGQKTITMAIAIDPRVMYSDQVQISGNEHGIVLSFMQPGGGNMPQMPISRIGMSRAQAKKVLEVLQDTLAQLDKIHPPKLPPESEDNS
jgi:transcriptional regulator with XRE-family HTH domain